MVAGSPARSSQILKRIRVQQVLVGLAGTQLEFQVGLQVGERDRHHDDLATLALDEERSLCQVEVGALEEPKLVLA